MAERLAEKVLLVGWDAAEWNVIRPLVQRGLMPNLQRFIDGGVSGNLASLDPMLSPMLWTSVATGKRPHKHGIHGFTEPRPQGDGIRPVASTSRSTKAIWNILTQNGLRTHCVNWYASHPAEPVRGVTVSNRFAVVPPAPGKAWPLAPGAVHPADVRDVLAELRVRPEELDGSMLLPFVPGATRIDQKTDKRLLAVAVVLAELATTHAAITWCIEHRPWDFAAVLYNGIDHFCHLFMDYHPPRQEHIPEADFQMYRGVITAAYCFHDMMLGRLMELAGDDATIVLVSDHGYRTGAQRLKHAPKNLAGLSASHRPQGVCLVRGPHVRRGETLEGASLLDVTPTVLTLLGLPVGGDMDGRAWVGAIDRPVELDKVMSWDQVPGDAGEHPAEQREAPAESMEAVRHLIELGYIEPQDENVQKVVERTVEENQYNLARALLDARQPTRAIPILESLVHKRPEHTDYNRSLFGAYFSVGRSEDGRRIAEAMWARGYRGPLVNLALGAVEMAARRVEPALARLQEAERVNPGLPGLQVLIGQAYLRLRRWDLAGVAFRKAIDADVDDEQAWHGLAAAALGRGDFEAAAEHALRAVGLRGDLPLAHYHLGVALSQLGRPRDAVAAFDRAIQIQPTLVAAYGRLVELFEGPLYDPGRARHYRRRAEEIMLQRRQGRRGVS
jgi:predicted AlkP superfamily phosphohydrolase/phosphomutase/tetratricopeptide (TPR) repeat protein